MLQSIKDKAKAIKQELVALFLAYKHPEVPWYAKLFTAVVIGYAVSPIDLIPDFIPVLGYLDDLILIPAGIAIALKLIPKPIMEQCRIEAAKMEKRAIGSSWLAAAVIVVIWAIILWLVFRGFF